MGAAKACFLAHAGYVGFALDLYKDTAEYGYANRNPEVKGMSPEARKHFTGAFAAMNGLHVAPSLSCLPSPLALAPTVGLTVARCLRLAC